MSGERFKKLSASLAARGAHDPDALAAYIGRRKYGRKGMAALSHAGRTSEHSNITWSQTSPDVIDLDWASWDAGKGGGGASQTAHDTASRTARRDAMAKMAAQHDRGGSDEEKASNHMADAKKAFGAGQHMAAMQHLARATQLSGSTDTYQRASTMSKGVRQAAVQGGNSSANSWNALSNTGGRQILMAGDRMKCPSCGYAADSAEFDTSGGASGTSVSARPSELQTPARGDNAGRAGYTSQSTGVRGASSGNVGLANKYRDAIGLARTAAPARAPIRTLEDLLISRSPTGTAVIRHRMGGALVGEVGRGSDNAWRSMIDGRELSPHTHQRAAVQELIGTWNSTSLDPGRPAMPLQGPPRQPELLSQLGISNVRAFAAYDPDADGDDDDSTSGGDTDKDAAGGLNPKGKAIYAKLRAKGKSPKAALAMAKMAQNAKPGAFGRAS